MWCRRCTQDVPGIPALEDGQFSCPRCGESLAGGVSPGTTTGAVDSTPAANLASDQRPPAEPVAETTSAEDSTRWAPPSYDSWNLGEDLRHVERLLRIDPPERTGPVAGHVAVEARLDGPHAGPAAWHRDGVRQPRRKAARPRATGSSPILTGLTWIALLAGTMAFVCGGVLLGWSLATGRQ